MDDTRPDPDALIAAAAREGRGRLKVFLGAAPGVGKTWEMLAQARRRQAEGLDVLAGVIETHGRAETEAQVVGLEILPRRTVPYRGQTLQEFDIDAALARRPALLLVDELAHTNAPGSRHAKRWEDVRELLEAGLDVWATLNVQHLESLNEDVARITGVRVAETLPDAVLEGADEIELIDVPPAELRARLADGRIYRADTAKRALEGYFKEGNLAALREIALRQAAEHVDEDVRNWMRTAGVSGPWPASERVLALVGPDASGEAVVRHAKRLADALHAPWTVLHVEQPRAAPDSRPSLALAQGLGAEVETRSGEDLAGVALTVARAKNATHIVIGRAKLPWWRRLLGRTLSLELLRRAPEYTLHVVPSPALARPRPAREPVRLEWVGWAVATVLVAGVTGAGLLLDGAIPSEALGMVFLAVVVASASLQGLQVALYAAVIGFLAWDFFFIPPLYAVTISNTHDVVAALVFLAVAAITGVLAGRVRAEARAGQARIDSLRRVGAFSRRLGEPATEPDLLHEVARQAAGIAGQGVVLDVTKDGDGEVALRAAEPGTATLDEGAWAAARWAAQHLVETGHGTSTLPSASWRFLPMKTVRGGSGLLGVRAPATGSFDPPTVQALEALADQAAIALERVRLAGQSARTAAMEETQRLRTALLNSLSHDLRTPLTGIRGAAETLRESWEGVSAETRADLLLSIEEDTARMTRFLSNIMDLTRLESGQVMPRLASVDVQAVIEAAIARVPEAEHVGVSIPEPPQVLPQMLADAALLEQVLVNLLDNAVKYSPQGARTAVRVSVGTGLSGQKEISIGVADEGVGIPGADLPHVFDSFYRSRNGDRVAPGTGLGLAIARGMTEAMGGTIVAVSPRLDLPRDGSPGTVVTLRLPAAP